MIKIAVVFPGQGSQKLRMLNDYYNNFYEVRTTFEEANQTLKFDLWKIIQNDIYKLNQTEYTQPALLASSISIWRIFKKYSECASPEIVAGHSLGEYAALCAAESISFHDALNLVRFRGKLMQSSVNDGKYAMSAIIALDYKDVIKCCNMAKEFGVVELANFNSYKQLVISGELTAVEKANELAKKMGARRIHMLPINIPSHCSLMKSVAEKFKVALDRVVMNKPKIRVIHNYNVQSHDNVNDIKTALLEQLYRPIQWVRNVEKIAKSNINYILECGANKVLTNLNKQIIKKEILCLDTSTVEAMNQVIRVLNNTR